MALANKLKMKPEAVREIGLGGMLFSIGRKSIPFEILSKEGELSPEDFQVMRKIPSASKKILNDMKCYSENILKMAAEHRERFDGTGYPFQLKGEKISLFARVVSIMDCFGALTSARPNRKAFTPFAAVNEMKNNMKGHFDTRILVNFIKILADAAAAKVAPKKPDPAKPGSKQTAASA